MRIILAIIYCFLGNFLVAQSGVYGLVKDSDSDEIIIGANVILMQNETFINGTTTDIEGKYYLQVKPGTYHLEVNMIGYPTNRIESIIVSDQNQATQVDVRLAQLDIDMYEIVVRCINIPMLSLDETTSGIKISGETIRERPQKSINAISLTTAGLSGIHY